MMRSKCNKNIVAALDLARQMVVLAEKGEAESSDNGCAVLFGVLRDCAYKIRKEAERERKAHQAIGNWDPRETQAVLWPGVPAFYGSPSAED